MRKLIKRKYFKHKMYKIKQSNKLNKNMNKLFKTQFNNMINKLIICKNNYNYKINLKINKTKIFKNLLELIKKVLIIILIHPLLQYNKVFIEKQQNFLKIQMIHKILFLKKNRLVL